jgi:tetratricopeptide (TPR) repeat protein
MQYFQNAKAIAQLTCFSFLFGIAANPASAISQNSDRIDRGELSSFAIAQLQPEDAITWYKQGLELFGERQYQRALIIFDRAIQLNPNFTDAWLQRGFILWILRRYDEAFQAYDRAAQIQPASSFIWFNRGIILNDGGRFQEAIASYNRALEVNEDWRGMNPTEVWLSLGQSWGLLEQFVASFQAYDRATQIQSYHSGAWYGRGKALIALGRDREGLASIDRALQGDDNYWGDSSAVNAWIDRGIVLENLGRNIEAIGSYYQALQLDPDNIFARDRWQNLQKKLRNFPPELR